MAPAKQPAPSVAAPRHVQKWVSVPTVAADVPSLHLGVRHHDFVVLAVSASGLKTPVYLTIRHALKNQVAANINEPAARTPTASRMDSVATMARNALRMLTGARGVTNASLRVYVGGL